ncbi:MAG: hypothetical protein QOD63_2995, partial [Actinomycetota bacterium]|nr:hypothetical protein [Actinomycetota bacterium]
MAQQTTAMRIFLASPGDVDQERNALARVLTDVNLALESLAPQHPVVLQLVRWETHVHPDFGDPQSVINEQLGDYDVFVGIMWKRFGTPTNDAGSGTEEEFRLAYARWRATGAPRILFYFSDVAMPANLSSAEVRQLGAVVNFREELGKQGLVKSYASPDEFPDVVRRDLIRLVGRILHANDSGETDTRASSPVGPDLTLDFLRPQMLGLAHEYERIRAEMPAGDHRTGSLEAVAARMRALAEDVYPMLGELAGSTSPGQRMAAVSLLEVIPNGEYLDWLTRRLEPEAEAAFLQYHAAAALLQAVRELDPSFSSKLATAVGEALAA